MIGIISDIHGNFFALSAVLNELDRIGVDEVICLGDIGGYYCQINECCDLLRENNIFSLMGNHDRYLVNNEECPRSKSANLCLDYQRDIITRVNLDWLGALTTKAQIDGLEIVHGGWNDYLDEYVIPSKEYFINLPGTFFSSGHTHVPCIWSGGLKTYCNPGSVGQPRDGDPKASFAIWNHKKFLLHRIEYDVLGMQREMAKAGFEEYIYANLTIGERIGAKIRGV